MTRPFDGCIRSSPCLVAWADTGQKHYYLRYTNPDSENGRDVSLAFESSAAGWLLLESHLADSRTRAAICSLHSSQRHKDSCYSYWWATLYSWFPAVVPGTGPFFNQPQPQAHARF